MIQEVFFLFFFTLNVSLGEWISLVKKEKHIKQHFLQGENLKD